MKEFKGTIEENTITLDEESQKSFTEAFIKHGEVSFGEIGKFHAKKFKKESHLPATKGRVNTMIRTGFTPTREWKDSLKDN